MENAESIEYLKKRIASLEMDLHSSHQKQHVLLNKNLAAEKKLRNMEAIFAANQHDTLEALVDNFITDGRVVLKKISQQVHIIEFDVENAASLQKMIDYLQHVIAELESLKENYQ